VAIDGMEGTTPPAGVARSQSGSHSPRHVHDHIMHGLVPWMMRPLSPFFSANISPFGNKIIHHLHGITKLVLVDSAAQDIPGGYIKVWIPFACFRIINLSSNMN
jgi:hypothetical protein